MLQMGARVLARVPALALGSGESGRNSPLDAIIGSFSQHHRGRPGSSLPATSGRGCQASRHELAVAPRQSGSYTRKRSLSKAVPTLLH